MFRTLLSRLRSDADSVEPRPPKPDGEHIEEEVTVDVFNIVLEYRSGDTENLYGYGDYILSNNTFLLKTEITDIIPSIDGEPSIEYNERPEHVELITRSPYGNKIGEETYLLEYCIYYEWKYEKLEYMYLNNYEKTWVPQIDWDTVSYELIDGVDDATH